MLTIHDNSGAQSGANCCSIWLIVPLVIGVAGLSASSKFSPDFDHEKYKNQLIFDKVIGV